MPFGDHGLKILIGRGDIGQWAETYPVIGYAVHRCAGELDLAERRQFLAHFFGIALIGKGARLDIERALAADLKKAACEGHDQPVLNRVFDGAWTDLHKAWRLLKVTQSCDRLEKAPDAVHFFAASAPWRGGCPAYLARGLACSHRHGLREAPCAQAPLLDAQRRWWREVEALPAAARGFVDGLLEGPPLTRDGAPRRLC